MLIDNITIIICIVVLLLTVVSVVANPFLRSVKSNRSYKEEGCELPPITVVVLSQNDVEALDKHLPLLFEQDYAPGFEVIVVGEKETSTLRLCWASMPTTRTCTQRTFPSVRSS